MEDSIQKPNDTFSLNDKRLKNVLSPQSKRLNDSQLKRATIYNIICYNSISAQTGNTI